MEIFGRSFFDVEEVFTCEGMEFFGKRGFEKGGVFHCGRDKG